VSSRCSATHFWLFPTFVHQQREGLQERAWPLLDQVQADQPPPCLVRLTHFAEIDGIYRVRALPPVLLLSHLHLWSQEAVAQRFAYRVPELYVLPLRVWRAAQVHQVPDTAYYQGCRSWVDLEQALPHRGGHPGVAGRGAGGLATVNWICSSSRPRWPDAAAQLAFLTHPP